MSDNPHCCRGRRGEREHDRHIEGLFARADWLRLLADVGFEARAGGCLRGSYTASLRGARDEAPQEGR